jgi:hypothetical protein
MTSGEAESEGEEEIRVKYLFDEKDPWDKYYIEEAEHYEEDPWGIGEIGDLIGDALDAAASALTDSWDYMFGDSKGKVDEAPSS